MNQKVLENLRKYLPPHEVTHCESEELMYAGKKIVCSGIAVKLENGLEVFGSSSAEDESALMLASFELLERYVILSSFKQCELPNDRYKRSLSSGVALHSDKAVAMNSAFLELVERNEILKSWYLNTPVVEVTEKAPYLGVRCLKGYEVRAFEFSTDSRFSVVGVFAFPENQYKPPVYGFGSDLYLQSSLKKAEKEFWTRFGFIGDEIVSDDPSFSATPGYHQDFYLNPKNIHYLKEWLMGGSKTACRRFSLSDVSFEVLNPETWNDLHVIKASCEEALQLFFGDAPRSSLNLTHRYDIPHPIT